MALVHTPSTISGNKTIVFLKIDMQNGSTINYTILSYSIIILNNVNITSVTCAKKLIISIKNNM